MIQLIDKSFFAAYEKNINYSQYVNEELLADDIIGPPLKNYVLLTHFPEIFKEFNKIEIFYNRYYWYLKFSEAFKRKKGNNVGIEQQEDKILEEGDRYAEIDWSIIEEIYNKVKKNI